MSKRNDGQPRGKYALEFKREAVRLVKGGQAVPVTAKILGVPVQTLGNWVRLAEKGQLQGAGDKPVSPEQMGKEPGCGLLVPSPSRRRLGEGTRR